MTNSIVLGLSTGKKRHCISIDCIVQCLYKHHRLAWYSKTSAFIKCSLLLHISLNNNSLEFEVVLNYTQHNITYTIIRLVLVTACWYSSEGSKCLLSKLSLHLKIYWLFWLMINWSLFQLWVKTFLLVV